MAGSLCIVPPMGRNTGKEHICLHHNNENFNKGDIHAQVDLFVLWCMGVHQGQIQETHFSIDPEDRELMDYCTCLHLMHIMPNIASMSSTKASLTGTSDIL